MERNCIFFYKYILAFFKTNHLTLTLPLSLPTSHSLFPCHAASSRLIKRALVYVGHISAGVLWSVSAAWLLSSCSLCFPPSREGIQYVLQGDMSHRPKAEDCKDEQEYKLKESISLLYINDYGELWEYKYSKCTHRLLYTMCTIMNPSWKVTYILK